MSQFGKICNKIDEIRGACKFFFRMVSMRESERIYVASAYRIVTALALIMHITFTCAFAVFHITGMVYYNAVIILLYAFFLWMINRRHYRLVVTLVHLEVSTFVVATTLVLGWDYGFSFYLIAMTALVYFNPFVRRMVVYLFPILEMIIFFLLKLFTESRTAYLTTSPNTAMLFEYINYLGCFTIILVGAFVSRVALNSMRQERDHFAYDPLTGVYRKEHFIQRVESTLRNNPDKKYTLFLTNIVGLKYYNEIFGEQMGNEVLKAQAALPKNMKNECCYFGRISGNEFAALIEADRFDENDLLNNALMIQKQFSNNLYQPHIHIGIYHILKEESIAVMLDKAAMAIESLQSTYGTCYAYYTKGMLEKSLHEKRVLSEFEHALEEGQFCFYLQPQVSKDGECLGAEALVRWNHPSRGLIFPGDFVPVLEHTGLIWKLDQFIWEEAVKKLQEWQSQFKTVKSISVNVSSKDFYYLDLYQVFTSLVEKYQVPPKYLKLEITETAFLEDTQKQLALIAHLQEYGFDIEIDDFGSGFSSLNLLKDIKANILKIDMAFLSKTENVQRSWTILNSIMDLAAQIGMETLTEGVETLEQMTHLKQIGCHMFQGYYFSKPIPVEEFETKFCKMQDQ